jgi:hypothetical protein
VIIELTDQLTNVVKYHTFNVPCRSPSKLTVVWSRGRRKLKSQPLQWQPGVKSSTIGVIVWSDTDTVEADITLYKVLFLVCVI